MTVKTLVLVAALAAGAAAIDGNEILRKMDGNRVWKSIVSTARMEIVSGDDVRVKTMEITGVAEGSKSLVRFTNPEDRGTKYLMLGNNLWIYFAEENDVVKISGHLLKEGMMGSDVSYEDALEADRLADNYDVTVTGEEQFDGHDCYLLTLTAKVKNAPYFKRVIWVEKERFIAWKEEMYAKSGRLLKTSRVRSVKQIGTMWYPVEVEMVNMLRKNSTTVFSIGSVAINQPVDDELFTMRNLRR